MVGDFEGRTWHVRRPKHQRPPNPALVVTRHTGSSARRLNFKDTAADQLVFFDEIEEWLEPALRLLIERNVSRRCGGPYIRALADRDPAQSGLGNVALARRGRAVRSTLRECGRDGWRSSSAAARRWSMAWSAASQCQ